MALQKQDQNGNGVTKQDQHGNRVENKTEMEMAL